MGVSYKTLSITKFGISITRYINKMKIVETPNITDKFEFDSEESENEID